MTTIWIKSLQLQDARSVAKSQLLRSTATMQHDHHLTDRSEQREQQVEPIQSFACFICVVSIEKLQRNTDPDDRAD